ncbi:MAG: valine--tRNA ligase [Planctomycetota bacterium]
MPSELTKTYEPKTIQAEVHALWMEAKAFAAAPDAREKRYVVMMPLPNVTGSLHMGHALDAVMQDLLIRWHRMKHENTLWMPGTDHAGIATQAVVEKRLFELEGVTRHDIGRQGLIRRIREWKDQYQERIVNQQQQMGCSCDWDRQRFTMDPVYTKAVRETFFSLFRDGLIFRGTRLVNWDCNLQTAISDDEIVHESVRGHFWHLRYPVLGSLAGEPEHVVIATTRPETMLGDSAVAVHPDPAAALEAATETQRARLARVSGAEEAALREQLQELESRKETHLPGLLRLVEMARSGRKVLLPLQDRELPLILDEWAKPELGSGCVKITPAHDPNDYEVWQRHQDEIAIVNILEPDGRLNRNAGAYAGIDRLEARRRVVADLEEKGLVERVEDREVEIGHSDRSKTPIEPFLSEQWFVRMGDVDGGVVLGRGTDKEFRSPGLAQAAMDAVRGDWRSATGRKLTFHPDPTRYANTYLSWLAEKRDWCISRQLWYGHRIPIWCGNASPEALRELSPLEQEGEAAWTRVEGPAGELMGLAEAARKARAGAGPFRLQVCIRREEDEARYRPLLDRAGLSRDSDVLDTWFSSALFPHATLGWPDPGSAEVEQGQSSLASIDGRPDCLSYYYPGSCLVTGRDIITLWVARMVIMGLYNLGDLPFTDSFIHANIQDGKGERMSKSKGNGIDPVDIIDRYGADAMRYVLCDVQTGLQDIRLPVQAISPFTGKAVDLTHAKHGRSIFTYVDPETGKEFDVLGTMSELPSAEIVSDRFDVGRKFCNKLWNASRLALMHLQEGEWSPVSLEELELEDRWILSRLARAVGEVSGQLQAYNPSAGLRAARDFFWTELCDWYIELIKPRLRDESAAVVARQVLSFVLDQILRLLHPFVPFVTEAVWQRLGELGSGRGIDSELPGSPLLIHAAWPEFRESFVDEELERGFDTTRQVIRAVRDLRARYDVPPGRKLQAGAKASGAAAGTLARMEAHVRNLAGLDRFEVSDSGERLPLAATQSIGEVEISVAGVLDPERERARLGKQVLRLEKGLAASQAKLANESFLKRAPPDVVAAEKTRLEGLEVELRSVRQSLDELS